MDSFTHWTLADVPTNSPRLTTGTSMGGGKQSCNRAQGGAFYPIAALMMSWFREEIQGLTGIANLEVDAALNGAGLHRTPRGGRLGMHVDFNQIPAVGGPLYRRVNAFIYLTQDWQEDWGGHLVLSERQDGGETVRIAPVFNRFVLFVSSETSWHGHPEPLACPEGTWRQSLAVYYYTRERPAWAKDKHSTIYAER